MRLDGTAANTSCLRNTWSSGRNLFRVSQKNLDDVTKSDFFYLPITSFPYAPPYVTIFIPDIHCSDSHYIAHSCYSNLVFRVPLYLSKIWEYSGDLNTEHSNNGNLTCSVFKWCVIQMPGTMVFNWCSEYRSVN